MPTLRSEDLLAKWQATGVKEAIHRHCYHDRGQDHGLNSVVTEEEKFVNMVSDSTLQIIVTKLFKMAITTFLVN